MKTDLKKILFQHLKKTEKLAILGIGSELMQDDAAGILVTESLKEKFGEGNSNFKIYTGYTTPENFTKSIIDFDPELIILIDSAELKLHPGTISIVPVERITDFSLGTHKLSLAMMIKYLKKVINCEFIVLAIQYKNVEFNAKMTMDVQDSVKKLTALLSEFLEGK